MKNLFDHIIEEIDRGLKYSTQNFQSEKREYPAKNINSEDLNEIEKYHSAGLMRVNHSGEVCAQALYRGQALTAKLKGTRDQMEKAAEEELDHLAWCNKRLEELGQSEISTNIIGTMVMEGLKELDPVAYVRFASVYRNFREEKDFVQFVDKLDVYKKR